MLTPKQKDLLVFIHERITATGVPPSFDEMRDALDLKSKSGIHRLITALEERGFIKRLPHRARAMEIVKLPDGLHGSANGQSAPETRGTGSAIGIASRDPARAPGNVVASDQQVTSNRLAQVPLMGRIAAGVPISAIQEHSADLDVPPDMLTKGVHYALEVRGDSMIDAGIHDGDLVIIRESNTASNGEIVVALIDREEATLKRLRKSSGIVALEAANPNYETREFGPDRVDIQGRLVGLIRRYQ